MKHLMQEITFILALMMTVSINSVNAEEVNEKRIKENGKEFAIHVVKDDETIYSISREYGISQEDIIKYNRKAINGVKNGMKLKLPMVATSVESIVPATISRTQTTEATAKQHIVIAKETVYSICRKYGITQTALLNANPELEMGLKIGQTLKIPAAPEKGKDMSGNAKLLGINYIEHVVAPKETVYSICKTYDITPEELNSYNSDLKDGLKAGQTLKIPTKGPDVKKGNVPVVDKTISAPAMITPKIDKDSDRTTKTDTTKVKERKPQTHKKKTADVAVTNLKRSTNVTNGVGKPQTDRLVTVSVLLSLMLDEGGLEEGTIGKFVDFYKGFLIGVKELKDMGYSVKVQTYDIEKSEAGVLHVLRQNPEIAMSDVIIGPVYSQQIGAVTQYAKTHKIPVVIPFSRKVTGLNTNSYVYQFNGQTGVAFNFVARDFAEKFKDKNILLISFNNDIEDEGSEFLKELEVVLKRDGIGYKKVMFSQMNFHTIANQLTRDNVIVMGTDEGDFVKPLLPTISGWTNDNRKIAIYGFERWGDMLEEYNPTYYYYTFNNKKTKAWHNYDFAFRKNFGTPMTRRPRYDMIGHDIALYFISNANKFGRTLRTDENETVDLIQSRMCWRKIGHGGYVNQGCWTNY